MQTIDHYASEEYLRLVLQGSPGSGKTTLAAQFPGAYFLDIDHNLGGALRFLKEKKLALPVGYDFVDTDTAGKLIPVRDRYQRMNMLLQEAQLNPAIQTIVIDSATNLADILIEETLRLQGKTKISDYKDGRQFWGFFAQYSKQLMSIFTQMRKNLVLIAHEKLEKNEDGAVVYPVKVNWPGQVGAVIGAWFTDVWRCEVKTQPNGLKTDYIWQIRTMPDFKYELKNSLLLPPTFTFDWKLIDEKLHPKK